MSIAAYIDQAKLQTRMGAAALARTASTTAVLNGEATARIGQVCLDVNAEIDAATAGLGIDLTSIPPALEDIGARLAVEALFSATWGPAGVRTPKALTDAAAAARQELAELAAGGVGIAQSPARQVAGGFRWTNLGDDAGDDNPRRTIRKRMRGVF